MNRADRPSPGTVAGIILAAGESRRMGRDKALLPLGGCTFLERVAFVLEGEVKPLLVVLGHHAREIERQVHLPADLQILRNPDYRLGQLSSLQVALRYLQTHPVAGALVCLVDHPGVTKTVVRQLLCRFGQSDHSILIPVWKGKRGHPVLFARQLFEELMLAPLDQGARFVVHQHAGEVELVEVEEEGITWDVDRPEDYAALERRWEEISAAGGKPAEELP